MAISKIIYKENAEATPVVWMDTTDKTADSGNMLNGITALKNDGTTVTGNLPTQASTTWQPSYGSYGSTKIIDSGTYCEGNQYIENVWTANLIPENIKDGVTIRICAGYGGHILTSVTGTYVGGSTYSVTISLTNPVSSNYFGYFNITEQSTSDGWQDTPPSGEGSQIGSISSPTGSTTITIDTSNYGFICSIEGGPGGASWAYPPANHFTCTGGVTYAGMQSFFGCPVFQVTGDGTVTIDGIIWNDD